MQPEAQMIGGPLDGGYHPLLYCAEHSMCVQIPLQTAPMAIGEDDITNSTQAIATHRYNCKRVNSVWRYVHDRCIGVRSPQ